MAYLESILLIVHVIVAITVCGLVLLQHGKGADMGAAFGSGSSGSLFGAAGSANFLSRSTAVLATVFFLSSLGLTYVASTGSSTRDVMQQGVMGTMPKTPDAPKSGEPPATAPVPGSVPAPAGEAPKPQGGEVPK
jgi:preprotein translocase subunit SecG